jgi:hypothetical protein
VSYQPPQYPQQPDRPPYMPGPPGTQYGIPPEQQPPAPRCPALWAWGVLALVVVLFAGVGYWVFDTRIRTDSGVAACRALRDEQKINGVAPGAKTFTEANYRAARKVFQDSRYEDIRAAGTKLMDVVWQVYQLGPDAGMGALAYLGQITSAITDIQGACANHGVILKLNLNGTPTPTAS